MTPPERSTMWHRGAVVVTFVALIAWIGFSLYRYPPMIENQLRAESMQALAVAGLPGDPLRINGRDAILEGDVSSPDLSLQLQQLISEVRGIRSVDNRLTLVAPAETDPPALDLEIESRLGGLILRGPVPNQAQRDEIVARATEWVGPEGVEDRLVVNPAVSNPSTVASVTAILRVLAQNEPGVTVRFRDHGIRLSGTLSSDDARQQIDESVRAAATDIRTIFSLLQVAPSSDSGDAGTSKNQVR